MVSNGKYVEDNAQYVFTKDLEKYRNIVLKNYTKAVGTKKKEKNR
ncbi:hypothetical protein [Sulfurimonas sp. NWX367]